MKKMISRGILSALAGLCFLVLSPLAQAEKNQAFDFEKYMAAWSNDIEKLMPFFTEDVVYEDVTFGVVNHGKMELRKFALDFFKAFPDTRFTVTSVVISGNHAAVEWTLTGTQKGDMPGIPATNKPISVRGVSMMEFRNGKVSRDSDYWDMATLRRQVGLNP